MQRVHALILPGLLSLLGLLITGCDRQPAKSNASHAKPRIVCTVAMIADLTQRIAGESADVVSLMGSGVDPHLRCQSRTGGSGSVASVAMTHGGNSHPRQFATAARARARTRSSGAVRASRKANGPPQST